MITPRVRTQSATTGTIPDMLSKFDYKGAAAAVAARFPHQPLRRTASKRDLNIMNS